MVNRVTSNDNECQRMTTSGTTHGNEWHEWHWVAQRMTTSDSTMTTGGTARDSEWQRMTTITKNDNEWQRMTASDKTNEYEWE